MLLLARLLPTTKTVLALIAWELGGDIDGPAELPEDLVDLLREKIADMRGEAFPAEGQ